MRRCSVVLTIGVLCVLVSLGALSAPRSVEGTPALSVRDAPQLPPPPFHESKAPGVNAPVPVPLAPSVVLWDNGDTDGTNGYSHADVSAFGYQRSLLDDFVVPPGPSWNVTSLSWLILWDTLPPGTGTDAHVFFHADAAGSPGALVATANVTGYSEVATGRTWFGRLEGRATATFDAVSLLPGTYWVEFFPVGPENSFAMVRATVTGMECWLDYADYSGLEPGYNEFGVQADLSFRLSGYIGFDLNLTDDMGASQMCLNRLSGDFQWDILTGWYAPMTTTGTLQVMNGGTQFWPSYPSPFYLYATYDPINNTGWAYFFDYISYANASIWDSDTTNNPPCGGP